MSNRKKKINIFTISVDDTIEEVIEKNEKLISMVTNLEKINNKLKSENRTLTNAWKKTEDKWHKEIKDVPLEAVFESIESGKPIKNLKRECKRCSSRKMKKIQFEGFHIIICSHCGYRNRIDEKSIN